MVAIHTKRPIGVRWRSSTMFICTTVGIGCFADMFLYGIIVPVLPFMLQDRLSVPDSQIQSSISNLLAAYAGASCLASPIAGILADKLTSSRQYPFLLSLTLTLISTILLAVGQTLPVLVVARLLQGAGGGAVWTIGLTLLIETVGKENLGKTIGTIFSFCSVAGLFAPIIGGVVYAKTGYNGVFSLGIAMIAIDFIMRLLVIEKQVAANYLPSSPQDAGSTMDGTSDTETTPLIRRQSGPYRLNQPKNQITHSMPILLVLRDPGLLTALFIAFMQAALLGTLDATIPLVAAARYGFDSLKSGLLFLPLGGVDFFLGPVFGWCVDRWGTRPLSILGFTWLVPALALLRLPVEDSITENLGNGQQVALYSCLLVITGVGLSIINSPATVEAGNILERYWEENQELFNGQPPYAQLYGIHSMVWSAGLTVGPLVSGALKQCIGYGNMNAVLAGVCAFTAILVMFFISGKEGKGSVDDA